MHIKALYLSIQNCNFVFTIMNNVLFSFLKKKVYLMLLPMVVLLNLALVLWSIYGFILRKVNLQAWPQLIQ